MSRINFAVDHPLEQELSKKIFLQMKSKLYVKFEKIVVAW
jgi:hypothetical protein